MNELVFAYGSNMCSARLLDYGVAAKRWDAAALRGYRLVFNKKSKDGSGKANLEAHSDSQVWGVLYTITEADVKTLDRGEGAGYRRVRLSVHLNDGVPAWVYIASYPSNDPALRPYDWYKQFLVEGAREHSLPPEYIADLEDISTVRDADKQRNREKRALLSRAES